MLLPSSGKFCYVAGNTQSFVSKARFCLVNNIHVIFECEISAQKSSWRPSEILSATLWDQLSLYCT